MRRPFFGMLLVAVSGAMSGGCALLAGYDFGKYDEGQGGAASSSTGLGGATGGSSSVGAAGGGTGAGASSVSSSGPGGGGGSTALTVLASGEDSPAAIAVDFTSVFWTTLILSNPAGSVRRVGKDGSGLLVIASNLWEPTAVALDTAYVYYVSSQAGAGSLMRVSKMGGPSTLLFSGANVCDVAVYAGTVYFAADTGVFKLGSDGSTTAIATSATPTPCSAIAVDASGVYWTTFQASGAVLHAGDAGVTVVATNQNDANSIATNAVSVVWSRFDGAVLMAPKAGGTAMTLNPPGPTLTSKVAADDLHVYWTQNHQVLRTSALGGQLPVVLQTFNNDVFSFTIDASDVYATIASTFGVADGSIVKFPK